MFSNSHFTLTEPQKSVMKNDDETVVSDEFQKPRRLKSRQVSSRFLSPAASATLNAAAAAAAAPPSSLSPTHRKTRSSSFEPRKQRIQEGSIFAHGIFPSSTKGFNTMVDHVGNEFRLNGENDKPIIEGSEKIQGKKQSSESARLSVDENALFGRSFRRNNFDLDSDYIDIEIKTHRKSGVIIPSKYMKNVLPQKKPERGSSESSLPNPVSLDGSPTIKKATVKNPFQRSNSISGHGSSLSQWALSPGRSGSPPLSVESREKVMSFSSLRPVITPPKGVKGVEKLLNLGLEFFKGRKGLISKNSSPIGRKISDDVHQLRLLHNRLVQWRFVNAKAQSVSGNLADLVEKHLVNTWCDIAKLQQSVQLEKLQLQKEKLQFKLNFILISQLKELESWVGMERQHLSALSITKDCLHSVICKVPLIEGAKIDTQAMFMEFRQASDLAISIQSMMNIYAPQAKETAFLLSKLAKVVIQERLILEEIFELNNIISTLEMEEISLKCAIVQMKGKQQYQQQQLPQQNEEASVT